MEQNKSEVVPTDETVVVTNEVETLPTEDELKAIFSQVTGQAIEKTESIGEELDAEFKELCSVDGAIAIPADENEKRDWFFDLVCNACQRGMTRKSIVTQISRLKTKQPSGHSRYIGETAATAIVTDARLRLRNERILEEYPDHGLNEDDAKRVCGVLWGLKSNKTDTEVKTEIGKVPLIVALNVGNVRPAYLDLIKLRKRMSKTVRMMDTEKKLMISALQKYNKVKTETDFVTLKETIVAEIREYFNTESTRGRGAVSRYAAIGSELDFDSND